MFFTDGSKMDNGEFVGLASFRVKNQETFSFRTTGIASIFSAEAMAIAETLNIIERLNRTEYIIFSDSRSVLQALNGILKWSASYLIFMIKEKLKKLRDRGKEVQFYWIPAHRGIYYNERADLAAKESIRKGRDSQILIPTSDAKAKWKSQLRDEFHEWCLDTGQDKGKNYFKNYYQRKPLPWYHEFDFRRKSIVSLTSLRSGHTSLRENLNRFNIVDGDECECDGETVEDANHVFFQCPRWDSERGRFMRALMEGLTPPPPFHLESMLSGGKYKDIVAIARFINSIELFI